MDGTDLSGAQMVITVEDVVPVVASVADPELPFVTIEELGILRGVDVDDMGGVIVTVTPTYSGCPATEVIRDSILEALRRAGHHRAEVRTVFSPPWTTDDITPEGRRKLEAHAIAPPRRLLGLDHPILCPRCRSASTSLLSEFGSTACKALRVCDSCGEPFDHFKEL